MILTIILICLLVELIGWFTCAYVAAKMSLLGEGWGDRYPPFSGMSFLWPIFLLAISVSFISDTFNYGMVYRLDKRIHEILTKKEQKDGESEDS